MIVDDSSMYRQAIKACLQGQDDIDSISLAGNGAEAIEILKKEIFDFAIVDLEMPVMDGVEAIKEIRKFNKIIKLIVFSSQNETAAKKTLETLINGANDFVPKCSGSTNLNESLKYIKDQLIPRIKSLSPQLRLREITKERPSTTQEIPPQKKMAPKTPWKTFEADLICIGTSTGGPQTMRQLFSLLRDDIEVPILIVQHMPPIFTTQYASLLNTLNKIGVVEAFDGQVIEKGMAYVAPGDFHMTVEGKSNLVIKLNQEEKICFVRPSYNVLLKSIPAKLKPKTLSVVMTGMGEDGAEEITDMKKNHSLVLIQDEESCVVWGMPGAVHQRGDFDKMCNISEIAKIINHIGSKGRR